MSKSQFNPHLELPPESSSQQQQFPSVYPKLPAVEEPPSYDTVQFSMPQPSHSQPLYPQYQHPPPPSLPQQQQQQQQQQQYQQQPFIRIQRPPAMVYGSIPPPNLNEPQQQQSVQPITSLKTKSDLVQCPHCQQLVYTVIDYESGLCTGLSVGGLFFLAGCHSGGCLIPFLFPWTKDVNHICPSCQQKIATFTRLERDTRLNASP